MQLNEDYMIGSFFKMCIKDETPLCPVYCMHSQPGLLSAGKGFWGFATITSMGRMLLIESVLGKEVTGSMLLSSMKKLNIKKNLFGQTVIDLFFDNGKDTLKLRLQIAPKIIGCKFPHQEENLAKLVATLQAFHMKNGNQ